MVNNKLLVIIVTYNAMNWAKRCFESLEASSITSDIFVVDNGSKDGTQNYIKKNFPNVIFHQSEENLGFGRANNIGLQYALDNNYDYVYLLNQDAWVFEDTFNIMIEAFNNNPEYGILSPIQLQANGCHFDNNFGYAVSNWDKGVRYIEKLYKGEFIDVFECHQIMAAHWMISRKCLLSVGGFSPSFPHYGEDGNYIDRTVRQNISVGVSSAARAIHDRENRSLTSHQIIYGYYASTIQRLSGWSYGSYYSILSFYILKSIVLTFKYLDFKPLYYCMLIFLKLRKIRNYRELSDGKSAFLLNKNKVN